MNEREKKKHSISNILVVKWCCFRAKILGAIQILRNQFWEEGRSLSVITIDYWGKGGNQTMIAVRNQLCLFGIQSTFYMIHFYRVTLDYLGDYSLNVLEAAQNRVLVSV